MGERQHRDLMDQSRWEGRFNAINPFLAARLAANRIARDGRRLNIFPGFRVAWVVPQADGSETYTDGPIDTADGVDLPPGTIGDIRIYPLCPETWANVAVGDRINMYEGMRVIGEATVTGGRLGQPRGSDAVGSTRS